MARTASTKTLAVKVAQDSSLAAWTRWQAILTLEHLVPGDDLEILIRQLLTDTKKGRVVRLCLEKLASLDQSKAHRAEVDAILKQETERLAKRDPNKKIATPPVEGNPVPIPESPETGQSIPPKPIPAVPPNALAVQPAVEVPVPLAAPTTPVTAQLPGAVSNRSDERKPIFTLPRGAVLERDEQNRLLELFQTVLDSSKTESQRQGARNQLEKTIRMPDAGRSMFSLYLLETLEWLDRHPEQKPKTLPAPPSEPNPEFELFRLNFSVSRQFQIAAEEDRLRRQSERANRESAETADGGLFSGQAKWI